MSTLKSELRAAAMYEMGVKLDDQLESARVDEHRAEGAISALLRVQTRLEQLALGVDKDVDEGKFDIEVSKLLKTTLSRSMTIVGITVKEEADARLRSQGGVAGLTRAIEAAKSMVEAERRKIHDARLRDADSEIVVSENGNSGRLSLKEQRLAEEAAESGNVPRGQDS